MWLQKPLLGTQINWAHPLSKSLVGFWIFNEGSGNKVFDLSGNGNHGTFGGATMPTWEPDKIGPALAFDGVDDYILNPHSSSLNLTNAITIIIWVKLIETITHNYLVNKGSNMFTLNFPINTQTPRIYLLGTNPVVNLSSNTDVTLNEWACISTTYDKDAGPNNAKIYLNSILTGQSSHTGVISTDAQNLSIGAYITGHHPLNGAIYTIAIYNRALNASEIRQLYTSPYYWLLPDYEEALVYTPPVVGVGRLVHGGLVNDGLVHGRLVA